jgi:hypothetical protein
MIQILVYDIHQLILKLRMQHIIDVYRIQAASSYFLHLLTHFKIFMQKFLFWQVFDTITLLTFFFDLFGYSFEWALLNLANLSKWSLAILSVTFLIFLSFSID